MGYEREIPAAIGVNLKSKLQVGTFKEIPKTAHLFDIAEHSLGATEGTIKEVGESRRALEALRFKRNATADENGSFWKGAELANENDRLSIADLIGVVTSDPIVEELHVTYAETGSDIQTVAVQMKDPGSNDAISVIYDKPRAAKAPGIQGWPERVVLVRHTQDGMKICQVSKASDTQSKPTFKFEAFERKNVDEGSKDSQIDNGKFVQWTKDIKPELETIVQKRKGYKPSEYAQEI